MFLKVHLSPGCFNESVMHVHKKATQEGMGTFASSQLQSTGPETKAVSPALGLAYLSIGSTAVQCRVPGKWRRGGGVEAQGGACRRCHFSFPWGFPNVFG